MSLFKLISLILICCYCYSSAAVVLMGGVVSTSAAFSQNSTVDKDPDPNVDQKDLLNRRGDDVGEVVAGIFNYSLVTTGPAPDDFLVEADSISAVVVRDVNRGPPVQAQARSLYSHLRD